MTVKQWIEDRLQAMLDDRLENNVESLRLGVSPDDLSLGKADGAKDLLDALDDPEYSEHEELADLMNTPQYALDFLRTAAAGKTMESGDLVVRYPGGELGRIYDSDQSEEGVPDNHVLVRLHDVGRLEAYDATTGRSVSGRQWVEPPDLWLREGWTEQPQSLQEIAAEHLVWRRHCFADLGAWQSMLGICEELAEAQAAVAEVLTRKTGWDRAMKELSDVVIYTIDLCNRLGVEVMEPRIPDQTTILPSVGGTLTAMTSTVGQMCRQVLKASQNIRGAEMLPLTVSVGDLLGQVAFVMSLLAPKRNARPVPPVDLLVTQVARTWASVRARDWHKWPETGRRPSDAEETGWHESPMDFADRILHVGGDVDPVAHGGYLLLTDPTRQHVAWVTWAEPGPADCEVTGYMVHLNDEPLLRQFDFVDPDDLSTPRLDLIGEPLPLNVYQRRMNVLYVGGAPRSEALRALFDHYGPENLGASAWTCDLCLLERAIDLVYDGPEEG